MGDHDTLYTLLFSDFWARLEGRGPESLGLNEQLSREWTGLMFQATHFSMLHVGAAVVAVIMILIATFAWRRSIKDETQGVVPPRNLNLAAFLGGFVGVVWKFSVDIMGEKQARRFLPFVGTLGLFIFCNNIQGLIPGFLPGTDALNTNVALALMVFVVYQAVGLYENGLGHLAHFMGPSFPIAGVKFPWMFPLMLPIELFSHAARPLSLSLRLMGNILADHKVVGAMTLMFALFLPVPFLLLGVLVSVVQTVVFTLLAIIYIGTAAEHAEDH